MFNENKAGNHPAGTHPQALDAGKKPALHSLRAQLLKPKQLNKREVIKRQKLREQKKLSKHHILKSYLLKAGVEANPTILSGWVFKVCIAVNILVAAYLFYLFHSFFKYEFLFVLLLTVTTWVAIFLFVLFLLWLALYIVIDLLIYKRRVGLEEVLPDFLLLASANIRAGMPIDRALWYAVRPRFGVLAKEMEMVAKETISGQDLEASLNEFADRYDSLVLKNTVSLLIESINAGGEIGNLLSKISANIQNNELMKKEMAAGISAYSIFIAVAAIIIAPMLFALSSQLLVVISSITQSITIPAVSSPLFSLGLNSVGVSQGDFFIFAMINLFLTALFSSLIVTTIKKGEIRGGAKTIPAFIATSLVIFFVSRQLFSSVFGGLF